MVQVPMLETNFQNYSVLTSVSSTQHGIVLVAFRVHEI
jgi:hypothetical protein